MHNQGKGAKAASAPFSQVIQKIQTKNTSI